MSELKYWLWLALRTGLGLVRKRKLIEFFGSPYNVYQAGNSDYLSIDGLKSTAIKQLMLKNLDKANEILS